MAKRFLVLAAITLVSLSAFAQTLTLAVPQLSPAATEAYSKIGQAALEAGGRQSNLQVLPFARALYLIENKQADVLSSIVQIPDQKKWAALKYDYSSAELIKIVFVLYTNKSKPVSAAELKAGNPKGYKIETDAAHVDHFPFAISPSTSMDASLKKLEAGDIDGFIFSQGSTDAALKRLGYKSIARQLFDTWNGVFVLPKGGRGGPVDKALVEGIAKLKASGKFAEIIGPYSAGASTYLDWQP